MSFDNDKPMSEDVVKSEILSDGSIYASGGGGGSNTLNIQGINSENVFKSDQFKNYMPMPKGAVPHFQHYVSRQDQYMFAVIKGLLVNGGYEEYSVGQIKDGIMDNFCQKAAVIARKLMEAADEEFK